MTNIRLRDDSDFLYAAFEVRHIEKMGLKLRRDV